MSGVRVEFTPSGKPMKHGGAGTAYSHYGCRCDECVAAHTARIKRRQRVRRPEDAPSHGSASTYTNWNCRCPECGTAWAARCKAYYDAHKKSH